MIALLPERLLYIIAGILGAVIGSFANVCIARMPKDESIISPRSHCPRCGHNLSWWENVPIFSFLILRGCCRGCHGHISAVYPVVEVLCVAIALLAWWHFEDPLRFLIYYCFFLIPLTIVTFIDLAHKIIPDSISIPGIFVGMAVSVLFATGDKLVMTEALLVGSVGGTVLSILGESILWRIRGRQKGGYSIELAAVFAICGVIIAVIFIPSFGSQSRALLNSALGALVGGLALYLVAVSYEKIKKEEGLGGGDIKLIAMLGAFFGWKAAILILLISSILGSIVGIAIVLILRKDMKYAIPFGPFLAVAGMIQLFAGEKIIFWYLNLFR